MTVLSQDASITLFISAFSIWKAALENETCSHLVASTGRKQCRPGTFRRYLHCHRSGSFESISTGQRQLKSNGSCKIGKHCFAMLEVTEEKDRVLVAFQKQHYGHTAELGHQRLSKTLSQGIAGKALVLLRQQHTAHFHWLLFAGYTSQ